MANRPIPDSDLARRAHDLQRMGETEMHRHLREEWEAAIGGARVAMDALRTIWPVDADHLPPYCSDAIAQAHKYAETLYATLDTIAPSMAGDLMYSVLTFNPDAAQEIERQERQRGIPSPEERGDAG